MFHDEPSPEAPTSAVGDSIILHVPACVQRFSSRRRILSRLRALARRRSRGLPAPELLPLKLKVEANPDWAELVEPEGGPLDAERCQTSPGSEAAAAVDPQALDAGPVASDVRGIGWERVSPDPSIVTMVCEADGGPEAALHPAGREPEQHKASEDPSQCIIQQLMEDNRDLKAALCRLIRISEQNHAALQLLEGENEELSVLVRRMTTDQALPAGRRVVDARPRCSVREWGRAWLRRRQVRRCT